MTRINLLKNYSGNSTASVSQSIWEKLHLDLPLFIGICLLCGYGLIILFSASNHDLNVVVKQIMRLGLAFALMIGLAQIPFYRYRNLLPWFYAVGVLLLLVVAFVGHIGKGAQRWLDLGFFKFQPSEFMKILTPMILAYFLSKRKVPPSFWDICIAALLLMIPTAIIIEQPDLGTAIMVGTAGVWVLFLSGMQWRIIIIGVILVLAALPVGWHFLHDYQQQRVLTFLNPETDPLGSGYHIIQSKIAIGSGGIFGKGYLQGTQSHLQFLPEHATDFIFAVCSEELGLIGALVLIAIYVFITWRGLYIASRANERFSRLLAGALTLNFFFSFFVNMGMVTGMLPVVGLPLPLVSYGGTAVVTIMCSFGILMSIHTHRRLLS